MNLYERRIDTDKNCYLFKLEQICEENENKVIGHKTRFNKNVQILFLTKGETTAKIGGDLLNIKQGQIIFIDSLESHSFKVGQVEGYLVVFGYWYVDTFNSLFVGKRFPRIMDDEAKNGKIFEFVEKWYKWFSSLNNVVNEEFLYETFLKANQLFKLFKNSYEMVNKIKPSSDVAISGILNYVNDHYVDNITIKEIALKLGYAKEYCSQIFNKYMGESFRQYLNRKRVEKFQQIYLAQKDELSVAEIAKLCGFDCQATFYRAYKSLYGKTPKNKKL